MSFRKNPPQTNLKPKGNASLRWMIEESPREQKNQIPYAHDFGYSLKFKCVDPDEKGLNICIEVILL